MVKLVTIRSNARLIAIQFLVRSRHVPSVVPPKSKADGPATSDPVNGKEVLASTKEVNLLPLLDGICPIDDSGPYQLVDAWFEVHHLVDVWHRGRKVGKEPLMAVRYVFCHESHIRPNLDPEFVQKRDEILESLVGLADQNLWATQAHLNPYFDNGQPTEDQVLMIGCAGRLPIVDKVGMTKKVWSGGYDDLGQGIGPKVPITDLRPKLLVLAGDVVLVPASVEVLA